MRDSVRRTGLKHNVLKYDVEDVLRQAFGDHAGPQGLLEHETDRCVARGTAALASSRAWHPTDQVGALFF